MPGPSVHELLGLPADVSQPNAYQVFGLELGETDDQVIRSAIEDRIRALKQAKPSASPETWARAARAVQAAQKILFDPEQKAALDAQYGIINDPEPAPSAPVDPLAALLPSAQATPPVPASQPPATPSAITPPAAPQAEPPSTPPAVTPPAVTPPPTPATQQAVTAAPVGSPPQTGAGIQTAAPKITAQRSVRRRRRSPGVLIFGSLILLLLSAIVGGFAFVFMSGGGIVVVKSDDGFEIKSGTGSTQRKSPQSAPPSPVNQDSGGDGIMKPAPRIRPDAPNLDPGSEMEIPNLPGRNDDMTGAMPNMPMPNNPVSNPPMNDGPMDDVPEPQPDPPVTSPPMTQTPPMDTPPESGTPDPAPPTAEKIAAGDAAIASALDAIKTRKWETMKSLAEAAEARAMTDAQKQTAETLFQFADLATFYRGAIHRAMADLVAGNEIKLTESMTFLVKQSSAEQITLYRNKREYPYTFDDLPLSVAHALAPFQLNVSSPEGQAAKAAFQAISDKATPGHRAESIEILRSLDKVEGADPKRLADFIQSLES
ncbi:hypothetical protein [Aporhodopirellula aestuarii]|uniref:J domain-containing protein n=1 Tax=Aporhodopirellula aestuarii TaxID=2950107 RepID=A0ABT0U0X4_9BACT|nr:hypothetical protein [Aporhodopirellula aestuarii]MCM2370520.1 hypothetical protein [Aporhodopirellula aestuarii]